MTADVLCAGIVVSDHVCRPVDHVPVPGELILTDRMDLTIGGNAANVSVDLARLGRTPLLMGAVGDDIFGRHVRETLRQEGVGVDHLETIAGCDTAGTLVINCAGEDRRFIHSLGANSRFTAESVTAKHLRQCGMLYLGGYLLCHELTAANVARMFQEARSLGLTTVLDVVIPGPGEFLHRLTPVLPYVDFFFPNNDEANVISGESSPPDQAARFLELGAKHVVITCGERGAFLNSEDALMRTAGFDVPFVDGTGSGDAFTAGFMHGLLSQQPLETCLHYGTAMGAACVQSMGASTGALSATELLEFCATHPLTIETKAN